MINQKIKKLNILTLTFNTITCWSNYDKYSLIFTEMEAESPIAVDILAFLPSHQKAAD